MSIGQGLLLFNPTEVFSYEEIQVKNGGSIQGMVTLAGPVPPPRVFRVKNFPFSEFCARISDGQGSVILQEYHVTPDGEFQDAIVAVMKVEKGKPFKHVQAKFFATDCMFHPADVAPHEMSVMGADGKVRHIHPLVTIFEDKQEISVINKDPIFHNGQVFQKETGHILLNFPLPPNDGKSWGGMVRFERGGMIAQMICGMHAFMQTYGIVVDNPYYAKTKRDGKFVIDQLPEGTYQVLAWHPHFKPIEKMVTVSANENISLNFEFKSKTVRRRTFESSEGLRSAE